ncbi:nitric oxide reductase transcriptional regulator NorR [Sansalvadorimonas verongulae]|nr:nitric oxide reductase transcriptional regulator NorR [Sansalvadorimonas verongulae]
MTNQRMTDLTKLALEMTSGISSEDRFSRMLSIVRDLFHCEASALLELQEHKFVPLSIDGLAPDVLGRQFSLQEHPRLEAIARAGDIVRFPTDSELPDPYDGLIPSIEGELKVHACVGLPLIANERLIGALTIDGFSPDQFDGFSDDDLRTVSAIASASLNNALLMEKLENQAVSFSPLEENQPTQKTATSNTQMIGQSVAMQELKKEIEVVANTEMTALILGETGTGKELVAGTIHNQSPRAENPMVYLNCAALPENVAESELFGHVKGAFTGAISNRKGKFELADNSTLFLDEVGELTLALQSKLLRVLQYGDLQRVGDDNHLKVNTRIVAATNRDLKVEVTEGRFRADLYHRLSVFPIHVPPLRDRGEDVVLLAGFFIEKCRSKLGLRHLSLSASCHRHLLDYNWPGNVRELEHAIHRAAILARSQPVDEYVMILPEHFNLQSVRSAPDNRPALPIPATSFSGVTNLKEATDSFQRKVINQTLTENNNNWSATAKQLGINAGNLHRLAKRLGIK